MRFSLTDDCLDAVSLLRNLASIISFASVTPPSARYQSWPVIVVPVTFILARLKVGAKSMWREPIMAYNIVSQALIASRCRIARLSRFGLCFRLSAVSHVCRQERTQHTTLIAIIVCIYIYSDPNAPRMNKRERPLWAIMPSISEL